jgi:sorbitol-specific phosphotransferase system component IIA
VLMTKLGKAGKTGVSDLGHQTIRFRQFQNRN